MRVVSWMVVAAAISVLGWKAVHPLMGGSGLSLVDASHAVGSVAPPGTLKAAAIEVAIADDGTVAVFKGTESRNTPEFEIEAPWIVDWRVSSNGGYELAVDVSLEAAGTGIHQGSVLKTKHTGNGVRLFDAGGNFYFRVNSSFANWTLTVRQLTPEEAAQYTPKVASQ